MSDVLLVDRTDVGVAVVTLNRPAKSNAISAELLGALAEALPSFGGDDGVRAVVLTGAGEAFCGGVDLDDIRAGQHFAQEHVRALRTCSVPVIAAINGACVTGGLELALSCDLRIASERARFADTHARIGFFPTWGMSGLLPAAVGQAWARQLSLTAEFIDAATALRIGLVNETVPHELLLERALTIAHAIASTDAAASAKVRALLDIARDGGTYAALDAEQRFYDEKYGR